MLKLSGSNGPIGRVSGWEGSRPILTRPSYDDGHTIVGKLRKSTKIGGLWVYGRMDALVYERKLRQAMLWLARGGNRRHRNDRWRAARLKRSIQLYERQLALSKIFRKA